MQLTRTNLTDATVTPVRTVMEADELVIGRGEENDVVLPEHTTGLLVVDARENLALEKVAGQEGTYKLPRGGTFSLHHT